MDYFKAVQTLHLELRKIDQAIATLEELISCRLPKGAGRRGRTHMSPAERSAVSERMKRYWESRRRDK